MSRKITAGIVWLLAMAVVLAAIALDREGTQIGKDHGPPTLLIGALLILLGLLLPTVRAFVARVDRVKVAGIEVALRALTPAEPTALPINLDELDPENPSSTPRIFANLDVRRAEVIVEALSTRLGERIDWIWKNLPELGKRPVSDAEAVGRLERHRLLPHDQAEILRTLATIEFDAVAGIRNSNWRLLKRFLQQADAVVYLSRLKAFDACVREICRDAGFQIVDWGPQPRARWPDFLAHRGPLAKGKPPVTFWISVRVAESRSSTLFDRTVTRLAKPRTEVPGGPDAIPLIVVPNGSTCTELTNKKGVGAVHLSEVSAHIRSKLTVSASPGESSRATRKRRSRHPPSG